MPHLGKKKQEVIKSALTDLRTFSLVKRKGLIDAESEYHRAAVEFGGLESWMTQVRENRKAEETKHKTVEKPTVVIDASPKKFKMQSSSMSFSPSPKSPSKQDFRFPAVERRTLNNRLVKFMEKPVINDWEAYSNVLNAKETEQDKGGKAGIFGKRATNWRTIDSNDLDEIVELFERSVPEGEDGLSEDEFVSLFSELLTVPVHYLRRNFRFMDANGDTRLSREEFLTHLLNESIHAAEGESPGDAVRILPTKTFYDHGTTVKALEVIPYIPAYVACGAGGAVKVYDVSTLRPWKTIIVPEDEEPLPTRSEQLPDSPTKEGGARAPCPALAVSRAHEKLYVSMGDHSIRVCSTSNWKYLSTERCCEADIKCISIVHRPGQSNDMLFMGDYRGGVSCTNAHHLQMGNRRVLHASTVNKICQISDHHAVSFGADSKMSLFDTETLQMISVRREHQKGIITGVYGVYSDMIVSLEETGQIRQLKFVSSLTRGDHIPVGIIFDDSHHAVMTAYADKAILLWDVRKMSFVQSVQDPNYHHPNELTSVAFDPTRSQMITAGSKLCSWPVISLAQFGIVKHDADFNGTEEELVQKIFDTPVPAHARLCPEFAEQGLEGKSIAFLDHTEQTAAAVLAVTYSPIFTRLITVDNGHNVAVWNPEVGKQIFFFSTVKEDTVKDDFIGSICLDHLERRLLTATRSGKIRMWNYNSGELLFEFPNINFEVHKIMWNKGSRKSRDVIIFGTSQKIMAFSDFTNEEGTRTFQLPLKVDPARHKDVMSICLFGRNCFVGDVAGQVTNWDTDLNLTVWHSTNTRKIDRTLPVQQLSLMDQNALLMVVFSNGDVEMMKRSTGLPLSYHERVFGEAPMLCLSESQKHALSAEGDGFLNLFSTQHISLASPDAPLLKKQWKGHYGAVTSIVWCSSPYCFVTSSFDTQVNFWTTDGDFLAKLDQPFSWPLNLKKFQDLDPEFLPDVNVLSRTGRASKHSPDSKIDRNSIVISSLQARRQRVMHDFDVMLKARKNKERMSMLSGIKKVDLYNDIDLPEELRAQKQRFEIEYPEPSLDRQNKLDRIHQEFWVHTLDKTPASVLAASKQRKPQFQLEK